MLNTYQMVELVRGDINDYSTGLVQGTDTSGAYRNADIVAKINTAQQFLFNELVKRRPELFFAQEDLTGVNSVYTLPIDLHRVVRLENSDGERLYPTGYPDLSGSKMFYMRRGRTLVVDGVAMTDVLTLSYTKKVRDLDFGLSVAGAALSLTLATTAQPVADYYVGMTIDGDIAGTLWEDTITAYSAARVATLAAQTGAASKYYGLVSELPDEVHHLIPLKATLLMKSSFKTLKDPTQIELLQFKELMSAAFLSLFGTIGSDEDYGEMFN
jgi:hypothetical protein